MEQETVRDETEALRLARAAGGSLANAAEMAAPELWQFRAEFQSALDVDDWDNLTLAVTVNEFVDAAGTAPAARRQRLKQVVEMAIDFYRDVLYLTAGSQSPTVCDEDRRSWGIAESRSHAARTSSRYSMAM